MHFDVEVMSDKAPYRRLGIEVTRQCNCRCIHCFAGAQAGNAETLPLDVAKAIVLEGYNANYRHLHITGGEPLLYDGLFEILDDAVERGYESILLNTNGIRLDQRNCRLLSQYPRLTLTISLEGTPALHNRLRGAGSYQKASKGLENGLAAGLDIIIFSIACKSLIARLPYFADQLITRFPGIHFLTLIRLVAAGHGGSLLHGEYLTPADFIELARTTALINLHGLQTALLNDPLINVVSKKLGMPWIPQSKALCGEGNLMVRADRSIGVSHSDRHNLGYYERGVLRGILAGNPYKKAIAPEERVCPVCVYRGLCQDGGLIRPSEWHMKRSTPVNFCQSVLDLIAA